MNWRTFNPTVVPSGASLTSVFSATPMWLEGSLAAVSTLAPVISIHPARGSSRSRRRSPRPKA